MNYQQEWVGDPDEASEFDLVDSADDTAEDDPEEYRRRDDGAVPEESDVADAVEQSQEIPAGDDDEAHEA